MSERNGKSVVLRPYQRCVTALNETLDQGKESKAELHCCFERFPCDRDFLISFA
jgi:hypothetical protein